MKALILCAGLGTRLRPITNNIPKPMIKVAGKPVLQHLVEHLEKYGITDVLVNLHYKPEAIYKYFGSRLLYFYEPYLLGAGETEKRLEPWLASFGRYFVLNGDTLTDINIDKMYAEAIDGKSIISWDKVYTGLSLRGFKHNWKDETKINFHCYWQDIGTPLGLRMARHYYEKKIS